ncbi:MAG TPA: CHAT domain-containing tetratricopeptide repeat protein [Thermoanaerobaculia bacterium]|nr:CHAT domain-containing tetratricopeptide repeat protein [Thermoanaerobaculia bacterium]
MSVRKVALCGLLLLALGAAADELGVREHHRIPLRLRAGELARVRIDQSKLDVVVTVRQAERGIAYEVGNPYDHAVPEEVFVVAEKDEEWLLDITPRGATTKGPYTLTIERRPATERDRKRAAADVRYWKLSELYEKRLAEARKRIDEVIAEARAIAAEYRELGDARREVEALQLVGATLYAGNQRAESDRVDEEALEKGRAAGFAPLLPHLLDAIASNHEQINPQESMDHSQAALAAARQVGSKSVTARVMSRLGFLNREIDPQLSLDYFQQAIEIWEEMGDRQRLAFGHHNIAGGYRSLAQFDQAIASLDRALAIFRESGDEFFEAHTMASRGIFLELGGRYAEAVVAYEEALGLARSKQFQSPALVSLIGLSHLRATCEEWAEAHRLLDEAEVIARQVGGLEHVLDNRALIDLRTGYAARALPRLQQSVDAAEARWKTLRADSLRTTHFAHERYRYDALLDALVRLDRGDEAFSIAERSRARALLSLLSKVRADAAPPELVETASPQLAGVQSLLDDGTLLLYFNLSFHNDVRRGFLWAVTQDEAQLVTLPVVEQLDPLVRVLMAQLTPAGSDRNLSRVRPDPPRSASRYWFAASRLSNTILGPVHERIRAAKRLVVVADGMLQYVPFAALPMPGDARMAPLADTHEVIYLPSASVLALLRSQAKSRPPAPNTLALFGDPVFSPGDARDRRAAVHRDVTRAANDVGLTRDGVIPRLVFTAAEAKAIAATVPPSRRRIYTGFAATKQAALETDLRSYRIVHFATHGIVDDKHPELSGLLLSLYDRNGRAIDGFLRLNDVFRMQLGAELVVLSGCRTGLGKQVRSEGMIGLARGFLHAGTQKMVVTLWNIDDRATAELMSRFYRAMLQDGLPPAEALRHAQSSIRRDPRWAHPYYWAAFTYIGDWQR